MRTVKDLRDLINVSRLTYRESDDEMGSNEYLDDKDESHLDYDTILSMNSRMNRHANGSYSNNKHAAASANGTNMHIPVKHSFNFLTPSLSKASPMTSASLTASKNKATDAHLRNSLLSSKEALLDRNSIPKLSLSNFKKPLPPLKTNKGRSADSDDEETDEVKNLSHLQKQENAENMSRK